MLPEAAPEVAAETAPPIAAAPPTPPDSVSGHDLLSGAPQQATALPVPVAAATPRRGFASGLGLAVMLSCAFLAFYAVAPRLADQGSIGTTLMEWRGNIDQGRLWLDRKVTEILAR